MLLIMAEKKILDQPFAPGNKRKPSLKEPEAHCRTVCFPKVIVEPSSVILLLPIVFAPVNPYIKEKHKKEK